MAAAPAINQLDTLRNSIPIEKLAAFETQLSGKQALRNMVCTVCLGFPEPGDHYMMWGCDCSQPLCMSCANDIIARGMAGGPELAARCPTCRAPDPFRRNGNLVRDTGKMDILNAYPLECPFKHPENCTFEGTAPELIKHLKTCQHMPICCPMHGQGCQWVGKPCELHDHLTEVQHGQYLPIFCAQQGSKVDALQTEVKKVQGQLAQATGAATLAKNSTDSLKRDFTTFARDMRAYMGVHGKKTKHASAFGPDAEVGKSTLDERRRQRQWWGLGKDDHASWVAQMRRRKALGGIYEAEIKPPQGWIVDRSTTRAQALPAQGGAGPAGGAALVEDDDDDDDIERDADGAPL